MLNFHVDQWSFVVVLGHLKGLVYINYFIGVWGLFKGPLNMNYFVGVWRQFKGPADSSGNSCQSLHNGKWGGRRGGCTVGRSR